MNTDMLAYLKQQQEERAPTYQALQDALKAFDTGLLLMFLYSDADVQYSQEHGDLPDWARPLEIALRHSQMASQTNGSFAEPWYIAQRLRAVANELDSAAVDQYERQLSVERMQSSPLNKVEAQVNKIPQYQERSDRLRELLYTYDQEWNGADGEPARKDAGIMTELVQAALDLGVPMPVTESHADLMRLYENLGDLINNELVANESRIERAKGLQTQTHVQVPVTDDPDGFAAAEGTGGGERGLFDS